MDASRLRDTTMKSTDGTHTAHTTLSRTTYLLRHIETTCGGAMKTNVFFPYSIETYENGSM